MSIKPEQHAENERVPRMIGTQNETVVEFWRRRAQRRPPLEKWEIALIGYAILATGFLLGTLACRVGIR